MTAGQRLGATLAGWGRFARSDYDHAEAFVLNRIAALVVHRRNRGLDFGAWKDLVPVARARWPGIDELFLVNDSVVGPIRPLEPYLAAIRAGGPGFDGMLESILGGPHMQS